MMKRSEALLIMQILLAITVSALPIQGIAAYIDDSGREWRNLKETVYFSWNEIHGLSMDTEGALVGSLTNPMNQTVSFDGWKWATKSEVEMLFEELIGQPPPIRVAASSWASSATIALGITEFNPYGAASSSGWSSTEILSDYAFIPIIIDYESISEPDRAEVWFRTKSQRSSTRGVYLYRETSSIPIPSSALLVATALGAFAYLRRKRAVAA